MIAKLGAIFWKDTLTASSYRLGFLLQLTAPFFFIVSFFFIGTLLESARIPGLDKYGGEYFAFALVGVVFTTFTGIALSSIVTTTQAGQVQGTLETVLTTQTSLPLFLLGSSLYGITRAALFTVLYLVVGAVFLGVDFRGANVPAALLVLLPTLLTMVGLGLISGTIILLFKQGDPISLLVTSGAFLLSGVAYPVAVLPGWMQAGSWLLPQTYALEALRLTLLQGASVGEVGSQVMALFIFTGIVLPVGLAAFRWAVTRARTEGSFSHF